MPIRPDAAGTETMHGAVHGLDNLYVVNASFPPARWAWSAQR
ncbi:hypothetical protein [Gordonia paraffinivorans]